MQLDANLRSHAQSWFYARTICGDHTRIASDCDRCESEAHAASDHRKS
jgi:hypothetical protein